MAWYLLTTKVRQEQRALDNLEAQQHQCFMPEVNVERVIRGQRVIRREPLFPRYIFIALNELEDNFYRIRNTRGVSDFIRFGGEAAKVKSELVVEIKHRCDTDDEPININTPKSGDSVVITEGPFKDLQAVFKCSDGEQRSILLITLLQHTTSITVSNKSMRMETGISA